MTLEQQVVSPPPAKRLKELGVKQESLFWFKQYDTENEKGVWLLVDNRNSHGTYYSVVSAFTVAELGEMLPSEIRLEDGTLLHLHCIVSGKHHVVLYGYPKQGALLQKFSERAQTEADARAKMLIYLIENSLITI